MALRVLASSFHADAAAEARGRFTEAAFIKPASGPQHPSGLEQKTEEGGAGGWQFIGSIRAWGGGGRVREEDLETLVAPTARRRARCGK